MKCGNEERKRRLKDEGVGLSAAQQTTQQIAPEDVDEHGLETVRRVAAAGRRLREEGVREKELLLMLLTAAWLLLASVSSEHRLTSLCVHISYIHVGGATGGKAKFGSTAGRATFLCVCRSADGQTHAPFLSSSRFL